MKSLHIILTLCLLIVLNVTAQTSESHGTIKGQITDSETGEVLLAVKTTLLDINNNVIKRVLSDLDGKFEFSKISPGKYSLLCQSFEYDEFTKKEVIVRSGQITLLNIQLNSSVMKIEELQVIAAPRKSKRTTIKARDRATSRTVQSVALIDGNNQPNYTRESYDKITQNEFSLAKEDPLSTFSIDVDKAAYSNVRRYLNNRQLPPKDAVRIEELINYFQYDYPSPTTQHPFGIQTEYTDCPWNNKHKIVHIGIQGEKVKMEQSAPNNLVFLLDVSGSMSAYDKLPLLKSGMELLIDRLRPEDNVSIVVYAGAAGVVLPSTSGRHKNKIKEALNQLEAGGSTAGGKGIELAYKIAKKHFKPKGNNRIILATDGDFNVGISDKDELVELIKTKRDDNIFLSVLGFGTGNLRDNIMEQLADKGNGNYSYIDNLLEAKKVLVTEMGGTLITIAKDVKIQVEFNPKHVEAYRLIGYENRLLDDKDFNDDKKDAGELGSGHTVTAIYEIIPAGTNEIVSNVDDLKYQGNQTTSNSKHDDELMTIKFRYMQPKGISSTLITHVVPNKSIPFEISSQNCQFSSSVATFGMLLRDSKFKADANYNDVLEMAKKNKGKDKEGYRAEFIRLVEIASILDKKDQKRKK